MKPSTFYITLIIVILLLSLGLGLRLYDLTDQPIDFHPTRQLRSAIIARGMYMKMQPGVDPELRENAIAAWNSTGQYEPSILEYLVARTYQAMGEENLWVARIWNSFFWLIGGLALFDLARRGLRHPKDLETAPSSAKRNDVSTSPENRYDSLRSAATVSGSSTAAAFVTLGYYLLLPFAVQASRSFQPDPGMVMWLILSVYFLFRWSEKQDWKWAILAGLCGGVAILTKFVAAYILAVVAIALVIYTMKIQGKIKRSWRNPQIWLMALLMITPTLLFYLNRQGRASEYFQDWTISLSHLLLQPDFYVRWLSLAQNLMGLAALLLGLIGALLASGRYRALLLSLWSGYVLYGFFLPYQMYTHSYYHLQLIPIIALSLAPLAQLVFGRLKLENWFWKVLFGGVVAVGVLYTAWLSIAEFKSVDYRAEPEHWVQIADLLPVDGSIIALTQEYGYPLMYYGQRKVGLWPNRGERTLSSLRGSDKFDEAAFDEYFTKRTEGKSYFLITAFNQYDDQPDLKKLLSERYPIFAEGDGYLIYDLR